MTAKEFGVSKSTVHKDVTERLYYKNPGLYREVKAVLEKNKQSFLAEKHTFLQKNGEETKVWR